VLSNDEIITTIKDIEPLKRKRQVLKLHSRRDSLDLRCSDEQMRSDQLALKDAVENVSMGGWWISATICE
jgi:hypothetical protein